MILVIVWQLLEYFATDLNGTDYRKHITNKGHCSGTFESPLAKELWIVHIWTAVPTYLSFYFLENQKSKSHVGFTIPRPANNMDDDKAKLIVIYSEKN